MAWREVSIVSARFEFCGLAAQEAANMSELCRRYGISRKTGYKWLGRYRAERVAGLTDRPRRPKRSRSVAGCQGQARLPVLPGACAPFPRPRDIRRILHLFA